MASFVQVASSLPRTPGSRVHCEIDGRFVSVIRARDGRLYCLDSVCYHTGGPLMLGDIEDVAGAECVRCPWHGYPLRLVDGARPYKAMTMTPSGTLAPAGYQLSAHRQRVHDVEERTDGGVFVRLTSSARMDRHAEAGAEQCESDRWAYSASAAGNLRRRRD
jgi:nitrite reductase/ring-hydroxylating ferredoxin subunit